MGVLVKRLTVLVGMTVFPFQAALAKQPKEFTPPPSLTTEEVARAKLRGRSTLPNYGQDPSTETTVFPWKEALFFVLVLAAIAPFAWRAYKNTAGQGEGSSSPSSNAPARHHRKRKREDS